ncbi:replicative DNA helicase [Paenibacillus elgii]|uniref:replicative DNA helicase n=1 Tax=Paenibacillus elgii TaxID=189691 RepID=UPI000248D222|nr:replicative DNA helicase [Paenibacillus elgii]
MIRRGGIIQNVVESEIKDVNTEVLTVASFFKQPDLFLDYGDLIVPKYDFAFESTEFLYNSLYEIYHYQLNGELTESKVNVYMNQDPERKMKYNDLKGYSYIKRIMALADIEDFNTYYTNLKKYSLLRELERKGFPAKKIIEKNNFNKVSPEDIIRGMEYQINTIGTVIGGVQDSVILGRNMRQRVVNWKKKPDIGLALPFDIINMLLRGLRNKKLTLTGMHSGCGKSRLTSKIACYVGILFGIDVLVAANEQDEDEWDAMVLSCVINNPEFHYKDPEEKELNEIGEAIRKYGFVLDGIDETKIVTGALTEAEEKVVDIAAEYIEKHSRIHFLELTRYDELTLKRQFKRHKIKGCKLIIYDTLKAPDHDWISFVKTGDMLKEQSKELGISIWGTFQLTDDSLFNEILNSTAIANGKHIKHIADGLLMFRPLFRDEYDKYVILNPNGFMGEERRVLDKSEIYYIGFVDKNRGGKDKDRICLRVDKGKNLWIEEGYLIPSDDEQEYQRIRKEYGRLKKEKQVKKLKEELGKE